MTSPQTHKLTIRFGGDNSLTTLAVIPNPIGQDIAIVEGYVFNHPADISEGYADFYTSADGVSLDVGLFTVGFGNSYANFSPLDVGNNNNNIWPADHYLILSKDEGNLDSIDAIVYLELLYLNR